MMAALPDNVDAAFQALSKRGFFNTTWVHPNPELDGKFMPLPLAEFRQLWVPDSKELRQKYRDFIGAKMTPKAGAARFHSSGKAWRDDVAAMKALGWDDKAIQLADDLRSRIVWSDRYNAVYQPTIPEAALQSPQGFLVGDPMTMHQAVNQRWQEDNVGTTFTDDFRLWLEVIQ